MPEFTIEKSLQEVTQIQHTEQDLRDLKGVGLQDTVNNMSVRDLLRESEHLKQRVMPGQCEELEAKVDATVETARQLGDKATEIIDEVGVENLDPDTVEKLVGVLNLSPEQRQELLQGIEQGSDEAVATFQAMLEEAIEDGADPEVAYAIAAVLLDDPNIPAHVKEELRQLAKELVEHIKELRDLLEDALLREALEGFSTFWTRDTSGQEDDSLLRLLLEDDPYEWCLELAKHLDDVITGKAFEKDEKNLSEQMALEREEQRLEEAAKDVNEAILALRQDILLASSPEEVASIKDQVSRFAAAERNVKTRLSSVRGRMAA